MNYPLTFTEKTAIYGPALAGDYRARSTVYLMKRNGISAISFGALLLQTGFVFAEGKADAKELATMAADNGSVDMPSKTIAAKSLKITVTNITKPVGSLIIGVYNNEKR